jgi:hypothetical protein
MMSLALVLTAPPVSAAAPCTLVFCAPGYPGNTEEAQPTMDALAAGLAATAGGLSAVYHQDGAEGLVRLGREDAALAMVTLPFYLRHHRELQLQPLLAGLAAGGGDRTWSLVAAKGSLGGPVDLDGWTVTGLPAYHPGLVSGPVLSGWGKPPESANIVFSGRALSGLRKASRGEPVAVLLDRTQVDALSSLPYGDALEVVHTSGPLPTSLLCSVAGRLPEDRVKQLVERFRTLHQDREGAALLQTIRMERFVDLDHGELQRIVEASD